MFLRDVEECDVSCYNKLYVIFHFWPEVIMNKKTIKKHRSMSYFIDAAAKIMDEEGIEFVTIRKVSDLAGYNSATLYNYFQSLDELILYASIRHLKEYTLTLPKFLETAKNSVERYLRIWDCFCRYSFTNPQVYNNIFFGKHTGSIPQIIEEYYSIFPEELGEQSEELLSMFMVSDIYKRNLVLVLKMQTDGFVRKEDVDSINEMSVLLYYGMLTRIMNSGKTENIDEVTGKMLAYLKHILDSYLIRKE